MWVITVPKELKKLDGTPFYKIKISKEGIQVRTKNKDGELLPSIKDQQGNEAFQYETELASYLDMLGGFINTVFDIVPNLLMLKVREPIRLEGREIKPLKIEDSSNAVDIFRSIHVCTNGQLELEKTPYEWLKKMIENYGVDYFGVNAAVIMESLKKAEEEKPDRAETRREKRASGKPKEAV